MKFIAKIIISLKSDIKDVCGQTLDLTLKRLNIEKQANMKIKKMFCFNINSNSKQEAYDKLINICENVLTNPVIETYEIFEFKEVKTC